MENSVANRRGIALVTGGAKRVGKAITEDLAANGFAVVIHANTSLDEAENLAATIRNSGGEAAAVQCDLTDAKAVRTLMADAAKPFGPITLLVNNASIFEDDNIGDLDDDDRWDRHFAIHTKAPMLLADGMVNGLADSGTGLIVNMIDERVWSLKPKFLSYTLSKSALWTATKMLAQGLAPRIRVNAIGPGPTLKNYRQTDEDFRKQVETLPLETSPDLSEFGATIRYFWDAKSVTGQMIALDGGQHLAWETPDAHVSE